MTVYKYGGSGLYSSSVNDHGLPASEKSKNIMEITKQHLRVLFTGAELGFSADAPENATFMMETKTPLMYRFMYRFMYRLSIRGN